MIVFLTSIGCTSWPLGFGSCPLLIWCVSRMDLLSAVTTELWTNRSDWLLSIEQSSSDPMASYLLSDQGTLLIYDVHRAFCAGAWISVIVLCHAAIDSTIRDTELGDYTSNSKKIFGGDAELEWLRKTRNRLVHVSPDTDPKLADFDIYHDSREPDARRSVELLFRVIYASPGT